MKITPKTRNIFLLFSIILFLSFQAYADNVTWDGGGDGVSWFDRFNWDTNIVPDAYDDITIDCSCTVAHHADLSINGSLTIALGSTLDMGGENITIGGSFGPSAKTATLTNNGIIINTNHIKVKGDNLFNWPFPRGTDVGEGPYLINSGSITTKKISVGNNNGGGKLTNTSIGIINVTGLGHNDTHVDGTICNEGVINVTMEVLFHGAVVTCGGTFNAAIIKLEDNPWNGGGASGGGSDIQSQSFSDGAGCTGGSSASSAPIYKVSGGVDGGPNGDNTYTFQELLEEFGTTDTNPNPQFMIDPILVSSCGETYDNTPPTITDVPLDILAYVAVDSCTKSVSWIPPTITDDNGMLLDSSSHEPGHIFDAASTTVVTYYAQDNWGNTNEASFSVTVVDSISPKFNAPSTNITQNADAGTCGAIVNWTVPSASDNCSASLSSSHDPGNFFAVGLTTVTYTASDIIGNSTVLTFDVTITDNIPPTISNIPTDIVQNADAGACGAIVNWAPPTANDNCTSSLSSSHDPGDFFAIGLTTVTYTATDVNGNSTTMTFDVTVVDDVAPLITDLPVNITQTVDAAMCGAIVNWTAPSVSDFCSASLSSSHNSSDFFPVGLSTVTYTATDVNGNSTTMTFDVTVVDDIAPLITDLPVNITQTVDAAMCGAIVNWTAPSVSDNCSASLSSSHNSGNFFPVGLSTVTYTATDVNGNYTTMTFDVTVVDDVAPLITDIPADITQTVDAAMCDAIVNWTAPSVSDNCSASLSSSHNPGDFFPVGLSTVSYTATDATGNFTTMSFDVTVVDDVAPLITDMPADIPQSVDVGLCGAIVNWTAPSASDNCLASLSSSHSPGDFFPVGLSTVIYTATDPNGNSISMTFDVTVVDDVAPLITDLPAAITQAVDAGMCGAIVIWTAPTTSDNCSASLSSSHSPGDFFPVGLTTVTYTATDVNGNSTALSFDVTVDDDVAPLITDLPVNITQTVDVGMCGALVNWTAPTTSDNCSASLSSSYNPGDFFPVGLSTVTYTAMDVNGNSTSMTFDVTVVDDVAPLITDLPADITQTVDAGMCGAIVNWTAPATSDNCSALLSSSHSHGDLFPVGLSTVTYTATDAIGNYTSMTFDVTVVDDVAPMITDMPIDITQAVDVGTCSAIVNWTAPSASDNCSASLSSNHTSGDSFPVGLSTITYTATDANGNSTTMTFDVNVVDDVAPVIEGMPTNVSLNADPDASGANVNWIPPTVSDACAATLSSDHKPGDYFYIGTTTVKYTASDGHGNEISHSFSIEVLENITLAMVGIPDDITQNSEPGVCGANISWIEPTLNEGSLAVISSDHGSGEFFMVGTTVVTYTATISDGKTISESFKVTVIDKTSPTFTFCPTAYRKESVDSIAKKSVLTWDTPTVIDACSEVSINSNYTPGEAFDFGITTVVYTAIDEAGNVAHCSLDLESRSNTPPEAYDMYLNARAGESIEVYLDVSDPDGDEIFIESIANNLNNSNINSIDKHNMQFAYTPNIEFYGVDTLIVKLVDNGMPVGSIDSKVLIDVERVVNVKIAGAITPDGDMMNDLWYIEDIDHYKENTVFLYDRWGGLFYKAIGYNNSTIVWDGTSNQGRGKTIPIGTYYYVIDLGNGGSKLTGAVELIR